ncbi:heme exporter protein CcmD [Natronospira proteinivora]|uniref:Heme exporter protein D n=1 Tax=Natronospira proteinivora TaxID=1807133 RepID=A0ABT1G693_9GAMM|nr:heme exporter protein CcmD [Natronospira proteinivora]MCP1726821.1 heme exporter protein CcmD [Natronospira proteinivora]
MTDSLINFLYMDGFAVWVWGAFGLTAGVMASMAFLVHRRHRKALDRIRRISKGGRS